MRPLLGVLILPFLIVACAGTGESRTDRYRKKFEPQISSGVEQPGTSGTDTESEIASESTRQEFDTPPEVIRRVNADYPRFAQEAEAEGVVQVLVTVDRSGLVRDASVYKSTAIATLEEAALAAAREWFFKAAILDGEPVKVRIIIPFRFSLTDPEASAGRPVSR